MENLAKGRTTTKVNAFRDINGFRVGLYLFFLGGDSGEKKKGCFKCGGDHFAKECDKPDTCRMCGEEGHVSKDCSGAKTHCITKEDGTYVASSI